MTSHELARYLSKLVEVANMDREWVVSSGHAPEKICSPFDRCRACWERGVSELIRRVGDKGNGGPIDGVEL